MQKIKKSIKDRKNVNLVVINKVFDFGFHKDN
jgi:hypothetical protein